MSLIIEIGRASPLTTIQDSGRHGHFGEGISASGPMDAQAFARAGFLLATLATSGIEFTTAGIDFTVRGGNVSAAFTGGSFELMINGQSQPWESDYDLHEGDEVTITPGPAGNYGYVRFDGNIDVPEILGSRATNLIVGLGGFEGRALRAGDKLTLLAVPTGNGSAKKQQLNDEADAPFRFIWGIHADRFEAEVRNGFASGTFKVSAKLDRMGVRLEDPAGIFSNARILSLVSDAIVPGDIQILGDGTPIVLMRDHQPTGGYPRIGTLISADIDRFAQVRPGTSIQFKPTTIEQAQKLLQRVRRGQ